MALVNTRAVQLRESCDMCLILSVAERPLLTPEKQSRFPLRPASKLARDPVRENNQEQQQQGFSPIYTIRASG